MHDPSVCSLPNGRAKASMTAMLMTLWYFLIFNSCPKILFKLEGAENHNQSQLHTKICILVGQLSSLTPIRDQRKTPTTLRAPG